MSNWVRNSRCRHGGVPPSSRKPSETAETATAVAVAATVEHEQVARSAVDMYAGAGSVGVKEGFKGEEVKSNAAAIQSTVAQRAAERGSTNASAAKNGEW